MEAAHMAERSKTTIEAILDAVCKEYELRREALVGARRLRRLARPRQIAYYLARHLTTQSFPTIAKCIGGRDHTTVIHGVRVIERLLTCDQKICAQVARLLVTLQAAP